MWIHPINSALNINLATRAAGLGSLLRWSAAPGNQSQNKEQDEHVKEDFAAFVAAEATPVKPKKAAIMAITKKKIAQRNISVFPDRTLLPSALPAPCLTKGSYRYD